MSLWRVGRCLGGRGLHEVGVASPRWAWHCPGGRGITEMGRVSLRWAGCHCGGWGVALVGRDVTEVGVAASPQRIRNWS